jgi:magnesium transporter
MITFYDKSGSGLSRRTGGEVTDATVWIDLLNPSADEEEIIERALGLDVPTRAEMREIEVSNRFYTEASAHFMTALLMQAVEGETPIISNVTFILTGQRLVTVRYAEPKAFQVFSERACACKGDPLCATGPEVLIGLLETIVQRQADHIERIQDEVETIAPQIFGQKSAGGVRGRRLDVLLRTVGRAGDLTSRAQESAVSVNRTLNYFADAVRARGDGNGLLARIDSTARDVTSLVEHLRSLSGRTAFLLDATLGSISNEQNQIIKLFSVMAVMLMPPTLVASVYGMNFEHMPELRWVYGYPIALAAMFVSALIPFIYFRHKGWL